VDHLPQVPGAAGHAGHRHPVRDLLGLRVAAGPQRGLADRTTNGAVAQGATALPVASGGASFTSGMVLLLDTAGTPEVVTVTATGSLTSIPVIPAALAHASGAAFGHLSVASQYGTAVGQAAVPGPMGVLTSSASLALVCGQALDVHFLVRTIRPAWLACPGPAPGAGYRPDKPGITAVLIHPGTSLCCHP
jgi:hypothetical protein